MDLTFWRVKGHDGVQLNIEQLKSKVYSFDEITNEEEPDLISYAYKYGEDGEYNDSYGNDGTSSGYFCWFCTVYERYQTYRHIYSAYRSCYSSTCGSFLYASVHEVIIPA